MSETEREEEAEVATAVVDPVVPPVPTPPETLRDAIEPTPELARKNIRWAWALVALFLVLAGGTFLVAEAYLWLS
jgi:hypothetical protein